MACLCMYVDALLQREGGGILSGTLLGFAPTPSLAVNAGGGSPGGTDGRVYIEPKCKQGQVTGNATSVRHTFEGEFVRTKLLLSQRVLPHPRRREGDDLSFLSF